MLPYWILFAYFCAGALTSSGAALGDTARRAFPGFLILGCLLMTVMIGFRYEIGGDWYPYLRMFRWAGQASLSDILLRYEPGYMLTNWVARWLGGDIWLVNLACGAITVGGIVALARIQPYPWIAVLVAIPYLVVVVAMGYTRQATALGLVMFGLAGLIRRQSIVRYTLWIAAAALFHKTAIIALPMVAFVVSKGRLVNFFLVSMATVGLYFAFLDDQIDELVKNYVDARYSSSGALVRVAMCFIPAFVFLLFRKRMAFSDVEVRLWRNFSLIAILALIAYFISPSSTAVDRVALYLLPMQLAILAHVPGTIMEATPAKMVVALYAGLVQYIWLNYAVHAQYWVPYQFWWNQ